jgi:hypothetical protein
MKKKSVFAGNLKKRKCWCVFGLPIHVFDNDRGVMKESQLIKYILRKIVDNFAITARTPLFGYNSTPSDLLRSTESKKRVKLAEAINVKQEFVLIKYIPGLLQKFIQRFQEYSCTWRTATDRQKGLDAFPNMMVDFCTEFRTFSKHCSKSSNGIGFFPDIRNITGEVLRYLADARNIAGEVLRYLADARNVAGEVLRYLADAKNMTGEVLRYLADARNMTGEVLRYLADARNMTGEVLRYLADARNMTKEIFLQHLKTVFNSRLIINTIKEGERDVNI